MTPLVVTLILATSTPAQFRLFNRQRFDNQPAASAPVTTAAPAKYLSNSGFANTPIQKKELEDLKETHTKLWNEDLLTRFSDLPTSGTVPDFRVPYSGHDYPDKVGGTVAPLMKYDRAFNIGKPSAANFEREDLRFHTTVRRTTTVPQYDRRGNVVGNSTITTIPHWYGHCNGWTAATIRHAEPTKNVVRNGVTFTPADIKGMLAEAYMYSPTQFLGGLDDAIHPATFHIIVANWIGRHSHPVAMESSLGPEVVNFPVHAYKTVIKPLSATQIDVRLYLTFIMHVNREVDKSARNKRDMYFHYVLDLNPQGEIKGGYYVRDSGRIDMMWAPLQLAPGGSKENPSGNPHINTNELLSIWRESVGEEIIAKWTQIQPREEEIVKSPEDEKPAEAPADTTVSTEPAKPNETPVAAPTTEAPPTETPAPTEPSAETPPPAAETPAAPEPPAEAPVPPAEAPAPPAPPTE